MSINSNNQQNNQTIKKRMWHPPFLRLLVLVHAVARELLAVVRDGREDEEQHHLYATETTVRDLLPEKGGRHCTGMDD
jgi:hypothetical protein